MHHVLKILSGSIALLIVTIAGDYCIKQAAMLKYYSGWHLLLAGGILNFGCAIGWFWIYRSQKFITVGGILSIGLLALSVLVSQFILKEKINYWEISAIALGFISLIILLINGHE